MNDIILGDCLEVMRGLDDNQFDLVLTDPPYGVTNNDWDIVVDFMDEAMRVSPLVILTAMQPYSSELIVKYRKYFKYEMVWHKTTPTGFLNANRQPLRTHEQILVFCKRQPTYNPQKTQGHKPVNSYTKHTTDGSNYGKTKQGVTGGGSTERYPQSVVKFSSDKQTEALHPTQKPLALFKYLISTYTNEGDSILDPFAGSGTTVKAAAALRRNCIGIEINPDYVKIAQDRLKQEVLL